MPDPIRIKKGVYQGTVHLSSLYAWLAGTDSRLLVELPSSGPGSPSPDARRFDEERSRCAAKVLSTAKPRSGEFHEFERVFWHEEE